MTYYRTYRPQTLAEFDNTVIAKQLERYLSQKPPIHAFLFSGPRGIGKTSAARLVAKSVNCLKETTGGCNTCEHCVAIAKGASIDVIEIDAASNRGIDEIRTLKESLGLSPVQMKYKVYIIDEVHMLTNEAFNALLKSLEEPPSHVVFILATTEIEKVLPTIVSRCVHVSFGTALSDDIKRALKRIAISEKKTFDDALYDTIALYADGSFREAVKLFEQLIVSFDVPTPSDVATLVGISARSLNDLISSLISKNALQALTVIRSLKGSNIRVFLSMFLTQLENDLIASYEKNLLVTPLGFDRGKLRIIIDILTKRWEELRFALIPTLPLELAVLDICDDIRISQLEKLKQNGKQVVITLEKQEAEDNPTQGKNSDEYERLVTHWQDIVAAVKAHNVTLAGILRSCKPIALDDTVVTVGSAYAFHNEKISSEKEKKLIAKALSAVLGYEVSVQVQSIKKG